MTMKETNHTLKEKLLDVTTALSSLLASVQSRRDISDARFDDWQSACRDIRRQINEEVVRVAVIGPVKSGKSTLINSLFKNDFLKRGAGIMTSIVTRIRCGNRLKAVLFFKSWDEVNADMEQSLVMLPTWERSTDDNPFDIRNRLDRNSLKSALERLSDDVIITDGIRNMSTVLLSLYLNGYDQINEILSSGSLTEEFRDERFDEHQNYVSKDELAVYLKDIELEINNDTIDKSIEIADCQGSDSSNPLHLAMIQDYLLKTHFIVYVISSRIGLREADVRFLSIIKKMGILENILFVVNCDFSEHESLEDMKSIVERVRGELALIRPDPDIFSFSALFNLYSASSVTLTKRDSLRLAHWMAEEDLVAFSNSETRRFASILNEKLTKERFVILLRNHLERMDVITSGIIRWTSVNKDIIERDSSGVSAIMDKIGHHQERMRQVRALIKNTLTGATEKIMKDLKTDIDRFFNIHSSSLINQTMTFVNNYSVSPEKYRTKLKTSGFSNTLYLIFQEFKRALDTFITETIDPEIARFVREIEKRIESYLNDVAVPYYSMASDDIAELREEIGDITGKIRPSQHSSQKLLVVDALKQMHGLTLPSSSTALRYSAKVRTEAMVRLGFYSLTKLFKKFLKKSTAKEKDEQMQALADGVELIKSETEASIFFHFENYRENFKFQYVAKLLEAASDYLYKLLMERFQSYNTDMKSLEQVIAKKGSDREEMINFLDWLTSSARRVHSDINDARGGITRL